jgi:tartrate dehydrogenase/decarboxylase/D-malate dehydrogenase
MGLAPSGNIDPQRRFPSMFEPVHGSAPDIMGQGIANPLAAIISGSMMSRFIGEVEAAETIDAAVLKVVEEGKTLPPDLGGRATTSQVGDAVVNALG